MCETSMCPILALCRFHIERADICKARTLPLQPLLRNRDVEAYQFFGSYEPLWRLAKARVIPNLELGPPCVCSNHGTSLVAGSNL